MLLNEAIRLGATLRKNAEVVDGHFSRPNSYVVLRGGERIYGDVILGADGEESLVKAVGYD